MRMNKEMMTASRGGENDDEIWTDRFRDVEVHDFTEHTGPVFPGGFNVQTASPKD